MHTDRTPTSEFVVAKNAIPECFWNWTYQKKTNYRNLKQLRMMDTRGTFELVVAEV